MQSFVNLEWFIFWGVIVLLCFSENLINKNMMMLCINLSYHFSKFVFSAFYLIFNKTLPLLDLFYK